MHPNRKTTNMQHNAIIRRKKMIAIEIFKHYIKLDEKAIVYKTILEYNHYTL